VYLSPGCKDLISRFPAVQLPSLDIGYFEIAGWYRQNLKKENFWPSDLDYEPMLVWDPVKWRDKEKNAKNEKKEKQLQEEKKKKVKVFGSTQGQWREGKWVDWARRTTFPSVARASRAVIPAGRCLTRRG
jgi:hypothetical protein